jgi:hypothetical protein
MGGQMEDLPVDGLGRDVESDDAPLIAGADYPIYTPYGNEAVAQELRDALQADEALVPPDESPQ